MLLDGVGSDDLAPLVAAAVTALGRVPVVVPARGFWRPAGERYQHGREDWQAFRDGWLDAGALRREVLDSGDHYLPALWDVDRERSARLPVVPLPERAVLIVPGLFLLGLGLPGLSVHLALSPGALRRRAVPMWQLPAFTTYDDEVRPGDVCDVLVRAEDPLRPAVRFAAGPA
ncbi:MAG: uridine kinase [Mycobacteriales bacterium]